MEEAKLKFGIRVLIDTQRLLNEYSRLDDKFALLVRQTRTNINLSKVEDWLEKELDQKAGGKND